MKVFKLIHNETIKTLKRTSTKVLIVLIILSIFSAIGISKLAMIGNSMIMAGTSYDEFGNYYEMNDDQSYENYVKAHIESLKKAINNDKNNNEQIAFWKAELEDYEIAEKYNVKLNYGYWKSSVVYLITSLKTEIYSNTQNEELKTKNEKKINELTELLEKDDFFGFIDWSKKTEKENLDNKEITKDEYESLMYQFDLQKKYEIYKEPVQDDSLNWKLSLYMDMQEIHNSLTSGIESYTGKLLSAEKYQELEDRLKIAEYRLENEMPEVSAGSAFNERTTYDMIAQSFSLVFISILMIIISGSSISTEISKGTIKFLLFTPNKRWKILLAKLISSILLLVVLSLLTSLLITLIGNLIYEEAGADYLYIKNGEVQILPYIEYMILYFLASCIPILVFMFLGFMLSVITRNTALSVGISIASYIGGRGVTQALNQFIKADWIKFIPFNNIDIVNKIFTNSLSYSVSQMTSEYMNNVSLKFSLGVLAVTSILMLVTMFDSFNKRDIV